MDRSLLVQRSSWRCSVTGLDGAMELAHIVPLRTRDVLVDMLADQYLAHFGIPSPFGPLCWRDSPANVVLLSRGVHREMDTAQVVLQCPKDPTTPMSLLHYPRNFRVDETTLNLLPAPYPSEGLLVHAKYLTLPPVCEFGSQSGRCVESVQLLQPPVHPIEAPYLRMCRPIEVVTEVTGPRLFLPEDNINHTWGFLWRTLTTAWLLMTYNASEKDNIKFHFVKARHESEKSGVKRTADPQSGQSKRAKRTYNVIQSRAKSD